MAQALPIEGGRGELASEGLFVCHGGLVRFARSLAQLANGWKGSGLCQTIIILYVSYTQYVFASTVYF